MSLARSEIDASVLQLVLGDAAPCFSIEHIATCGSTNSLLMEQAATGAARGLVLWADNQTAGRGRRGRNWFSAPEHSLTFSVLWRFGRQASIEGLSLVVGLAVAQALEDLGFEGIGLKWPNDIWLFGRKLGGVLIELVFDQEGFQAVIGIGLNLRVHPDWSTCVDQEFAALEMAAVPPPREILLGTILRRLQASLAVFEQTGFGPLCGDWNRRNALYGLPVSVRSESSEQKGVCGKALQDGSLELLSMSGGRLQINGGDISLRLDSAHSV